MRKLKVLSVFGTRPEAIKMAPLIRLLNQTDGISQQVCFSGQHDGLLVGLLDFFDIRPHYRLKTMRAGQDLTSLTSRLLLGLGGVLREVRPDWVLVHGDTATCFAATLAAFYAQIKTGHVEAGLRSHSLSAPFPEEANRIMADRLASAHFVPSQASARNLIAEGIRPETIVTTGNTVIDALKWTMERNAGFPGKLPSFVRDVVSDRPFILVTCHRRENTGRGLAGLCKALTDLAAAYPALHIVFPVHLNPAVREIVFSRLSGRPTIHLLPPLGYPDFVGLLHRCRLVLTDSGGVVEEATALQKPVLVLRDVTERNELERFEGVLRVGTNPGEILSQAAALLQQPYVQSSTLLAGHPYGDGTASHKITAALLRLSDLTSA